MKRILIIAMLGILSACTEYREPTVNCFNFLPTAPGEKDCDFTPLDGATLDGEQIG